ncbi:MAG TPA: cation:proton antiporter [Candidatus Woesebacteria bacterium]|nr:cation:proton antiporter [Candidatus Woesebacteria bacterium]
MNIFFELSLLLTVTAIITLAVRKLRQPLVVGYILSGIIAGPYVLNIVSSQHELELFSKVGIVFLLFIVGLYLNPKIIQEVGKVSLVTGLGQVLFTSLIGFALTLLLGIDRLAALYVAIALTFSSTIIILKLIADKKDLQKLYAKIAIGFLLVQDIVATFILIAITVVSGQSDMGLGSTLLLTLGKGMILFSVLGMFQRYILPKVTEYAAESPELLFLFSLAWGTILASLFSALGFSIEIGALIAGVTLSVSPYSVEIASRLKPLRDFFIIIFFVLLGSQLILSNLAQLLFPAIILSLFVLVGNPIIVIILMNTLGYNRKTSYQAGLTVAQISEFSLILGALGLRLGHLSQEVLSLITLVGLITISGSTYLILYSETIYPKVSRYLSWLELIKTNVKSKGKNPDDFESVIFGFDRVGHYFAQSLQLLDHSFLVVDFNPASAEKLENTGYQYRLGDASDPEFLEDLPIVKPKIIISTVPELATNILIVHAMRAKNKKAVIIPIAQTHQDASELYEAGASYVMMPHHLGAQHMSKMIARYGSDHSLYETLKKRHVSELAAMFKA